MRILLTTTRVLLMTAVLILSLLAGRTESNPERDRNKHSSSSANLEMMDHHFHRDIHDDHDDPFGHSSSGLIGLDQDSHLPTQGICEPIKVGLCMGIGYNMTAMPNLVGHDAQADADALLQTFQPLIQYGCSPHLKLFLCSAHVPMCSDKIPTPIGPCRSLCESVRLKCEPVLKEFGFEWPSSLLCSKFYPENNHEHMCNPGPEHYQNPLPGSGGTPKRDQGYHSSSFPSDYQNRDRLPPSTYNGGYNNKNSPSASVPVITPNSYDPSKASSLPNNPSKNSQHDGMIINSKHNQSPKVDSPYISSSSGGGGGVLNNKDSNNAGSGGESQIGQNECIGPRKVWAKGSCWLRCSAASLDYMNSYDSSSSNSGISSSLFHPSEKAFARNYALLWAILSLSAAIVSLTLSVCWPRFSVAERPILYIALCQVLFSIGVIIGSTSTVSCFVDKATGSNLLARGGMIPSSCAFVFLLTYFFGTATTMWWVILCLCWLLSLNRDTASSLLHKEWSLFHLVSWGVASVLTSTALVHKKVDADELTGICGVGFQDMEALSYYNLIPLSISLSFGLMFLFVGLIVRSFFPEWNLPVCNLRFLKRKNPTSAQNRNAGCELSNNSAATTTASHQTGQTHTHLQNSFRAPHGYSPVLVAPPSHSHPQNVGMHGYSHCNMDRGQIHLHQHQHGHYTSCMTSNGPCVGITMGNGSNNNNGGGHHFYSNGNSPASVVGIGGIQRLRALENNTKVIWMRIGIFCLVYSLPIICQVGTIIYELFEREKWETGKERPNLQIFLLRLNTNLIAGLTTGVWVLSTYSGKSLLTFTRRLCACLTLPKPKTKLHLPHEQKVAVPNSVVAPLLTTNNVNQQQQHNMMNVNLPPIPVPSGSSSSSNNHNSTMPILGSNNTFTTRGALAPHNIPSAANFPRNHYNHPLPPVPPRNPDHIWRRGETIV